MANPNSRQDDHPIPTIGLVGGIASGKSFVAKALIELGCVHLDADRIGHEMLDEPSVQNQLRQTFGKEIFTETGSIDRAKLGAIVFGDSEEAQDRRRQLERILHPAIRAEAMRRIRQYQESETPPRAIVLDAPLLIEAGWAKTCDAILFIDTPEDIRRERALARGWTEQHWLAREQSQLSLEQKRQAATHIIRGDADPIQLKQLLKAVLK